MFIFLDAGRKFGPPSSSREDNYESRLALQSPNNPIPLFDNQNLQNSRAAQTDNRPSASHNDIIYAS